jgi:hypothetical protein
VHHAGAESQWFFANQKRGLGRGIPIGREWKNAMCHIRFEKELSFTGNFSDSFGAAMVGFLAAPVIANYRFFP